MLRMEPVSVTGMGCVCAAGTNLKDILRALEAGQRAPLPHRVSKVDTPEPTLSSKCLNTSGANKQETVLICP